MIQTTAIVPMVRLLEAVAAHRSVYWSTLAPKTREEYSAIARHAVAELPDVFGVGDVMRWRCALLNRYSLSYANECVRVMRTIVGRAGVVTGDTELTQTFAQVTPVREPARLPRCPPRDFMRRSLAIARSPAEELFLGLAGFAGLRVGEILGLKADDYDPVYAVIHVCRQRERDCRKNRAPHVVRLDTPEMRDWLAWTIAKGDALRATRGPRGQKCAGYLFPWGKKAVDAFLGRIRTSLGPTYLPAGLGWHAWRHWGATELARDGASVWDIQAWLGDADPRLACRYVQMVRGETSANVSRLTKVNKKIARARGSNRELAHKHLPSTGPRYGDRGRDGGNARRAIDGVNRTKSPR